MPPTHDEAHRVTDVLLSELEARLRDEYRKASKEARKKLDDYLRRFRAKDEVWRKRVAEGDAEAEDYKRWRRGQIMAGQRWGALQATLAQDLRNVDKIARSIVDGYTPEIYALNYNFAGFAVERDSLVDTSFTLYSREAVEYIIRDDPDLLPPPGKRMAKAIAEKKALQWGRQQVQSCFIASITLGDSIPQMAERVSRDLGTRSLSDAVRYARTAATGAENRGRDDAYARAERKKIPLTRIWLATLDNRTRHTHRRLHGEKRDGERYSNGLRYPGDPSGRPEEIWNCFIGETLIASDSEIVRSYKHEYSGELVTVETARGVKFTCTTNHPILTPRGWVGAGFLNNGDDLLVTVRVDEISARANPDIEHILPRIDAIHELFNMLGGKRVARLGVNFHGDIPTSDVEIITKKRFLRGDGDSGGNQRLLKFHFVFPDALAFGFRHFTKRFLAIRKAAFRLIRGEGVRFPLFRRHAGHSDKHGFRDVADMDSATAEASVNNASIDADFLCNLLDGFSGEVIRDKIVSIDKVVSHCFVYNLQTKNGYYFVDGNIISQSGRKRNNNIFAIAKNCRCCQTASVLDDVEIPKTSPKLGEMSFEEWLEARPVYNPQTLPVDKANAIKAAHIANYRKARARLK